MNRQSYSFIHERDASPKLLLSEPSGYTAEILLFGAQVVSWKNERRQELLFVSSRAAWNVSKAIRGGVPICFPQFSNLGTLEQHGFARNRLWSVDKSPSPLPSPSPPTSTSASTSTSTSGSTPSTIDLVLKSTEDDLKTWPHRFELRIRISLSAGKITWIPRVRNIDSRPFTFTFALRNYMPVSDISEVRVEGLETLDYFDHLLQGERCTEQADAITFDGEIDRAYLSTPSKIAVIDHERKVTYELRKEAMCDAVVWNPWDKKAKALPDLGDSDYKKMVCVDSAVIETPIALKPGEEWKGRQDLIYVSSSYFSGTLDPSKVLGYMGMK